MIKLKLLIEDEVDDAFGKVPFASKRAFNKIKNLPYDDNVLDSVNDAIKNYLKTPGENLSDIELKILIAIVDWVQGFRSGMTKSANTLIKFKSLLQLAKSKFPQVFEPSTAINTPVYRGVHGDWIDKILNTNRSDWEPYKSPDWNSCYIRKRPVDYNPRTVLQSWTTDAEVARWFGSTTTKNLEGGRGTIILISELSNDFIFNENFLGTVYAAVSDADKNESEVVHFGVEYAKPVNVLISETVYKSIKND
jgi:hypothetical protein